LSKFVSIIMNAVNRIGVYILISYPSLIESSVMSRYLHKTNHIFT